MRTHGNLTRWNDERGFGFITTPKGEEIFVHIKAFPRGHRPEVGELISFETEVDQRNRTRAVRVMRPGARSDVHHDKREPHPQRRGHRQRPTRRTFRSKVAIVAVATLAAYGYSRLADREYPVNDAPPTLMSEDTAVERATPSPAFRCDGRTRCPEMRSCAEARFFLLNCPGTTMDGDGDGVPCEDQWCGH